MDEFWPVLIWLIVVAGQLIYRHFIVKRPDEPGKTEASRQNAPVLPEKMVSPKMQVRPVFDSPAASSQQTPFAATRMASASPEKDISDINLSETADELQIEELAPASTLTKNRAGGNATWQQPLSQATWRQGIVMSIVLQAPRATNPYRLDDR